MDGQLSYLLTPWCTVLLEKLTGLQLVKKFPAFHGTRKFIITFTSARHLTLSWASLIQSILPHPTSWISILILSSHLRLGLYSGFVPSDFRTKTLYTPLPSSIRVISSKKEGRHTGRFVMYSGATNIYYRKTVGHLFTKPVQIEGTTQNIFPQ